MNISFHNQGALEVMPCRPLVEGTRKVFVTLPLLFHLDGIMRKTALISTDTLRSVPGRSDHRRKAITLMAISRSRPTNSERNPCTSTTFQTRVIHVQETHSHPARSPALAYF